MHDQPNTEEAPAPIVEPSPIAILVTLAKYAARKALAEKQILEAESKILEAA